MDGDIFVEIIGWLLIMGPLTVLAMSVWVVGAYAVCVILKMVWDWLTGNLDNNPSKTSQRRQ